MADKFKACSVDDCNGNAHSSAAGKKGMCSKHYQRFLAHGDPLKTKQAPKGDLWKFYSEVVLQYEGDECLIWPYKGTKGYATMSKDGRKGIIVSRHLCEEVNGPPPTPQHHAAHSCGNGNLGCVTKRHMSWKTPSENQLDRADHGTHRRGERSHFAKLTEGVAREILSRKGKETPTSISRRLGVHLSTVSSILHGRSWSWIDS